MWPRLDEQLTYCINQLKQDFSYIEAYNKNMSDEDKEKIIKIMENTYLQLEDFIRKASVYKEL